MTNHTMFLFLFGFLLSSTARAERAENILILDETAVRNLQLESTVVFLEPFERTQTVLGRVEVLPERQSVLSSRVPGRIVSILVSEGQRVESGQALALLEPQAAQSERPPLELKAPADGRVVRMNLRLGATVDPGEVLMEISDTSRLRVVLQLPESLTARIPDAAQVRVKVPGLSSDLPVASIERFADHLDSAKGWLDAFLTVENADGRLRPGMRVEGEVILDRREDVLSVPREAVRGDTARPVVFVKDFELPHAFLRSPVVLGSRNESRVEILSGLFEGDEVITRGSYALSFTGSGSGPSLKEALDAAHGHEHNEDGSEIEPGHSSTRDDHDHSDTSPRPHRPWLLGYAAGVTLLCLILGDLLRRARRTI
ncbi:MAG: efflux RND transporter periplasmic adaptor subunit [Verrucomicrobia bacterium]|nr:efflux RND transporter periplasmic adaptor subunit [Verrucomicrobiota bacterium]MCH8513444.1 efflux RND transporter periplasmic adaptor subunit [Kiritimatiellia bacterium]